MSVHLVLYMYDCRSPLPGASIWCYICTTVGVLLPGASIWCYICTTVGVHYQERPSGAIYVRL